MPSKSHLPQHKIFSKPYPFEIFLPQEGLHQPIIFQTPILGRFTLFEDLHFERHWARFFAQQGFVSVLIDRPIFRFNTKSGLEQIQAYIMDSLQRNQAVFESVLKEGYGDPLRTGSYGISFGSIVNCLWASQEKRLGVNVFALGGGNLPEIFMTSGDPLMASYRRDALETCGGDPVKLRKSLEQLFLLDPLSCGNLSPENTMMILARFDHVVPFRSCGMALREKLGNPKTIYLPLGHYLSMLLAPGLKWKVVGFFKEKFNSRKSA